MRRVLIVVHIFFCLFANSVVFSQEDDGLNFSGFFRTDVGVAWIISNNSLERYSYTGRNTFRLDFVNKDTTYGKIDGSIDFYILSGEKARPLTFQTNGILIGDEVLLWFELRKLYLLTRFEWIDISIGRQLMKFGKGVVFSPINFFDRLNLTDINFSRVGVDAIRVKIPILDTGAFDIVSIPKTEITNSDVSTRIIFSVLGTELEGIFGYFGKDEYLRGGFSFKGDIEIGIYGEFVYNYNEEESKRYFEFMVGGDYSFLDHFISRVEYYYNSYDKEGLTLMQSIKLKHYPFVSKDYILLQLSYTPDALNTITLSYIKNLEKEGFILYLEYRRNLFQNVNFYTDVRFFYRDISGIITSQANSLYTSLSFDVKF